MAQDWITTRQAAEISGYSMKHVRRLITSGKVTGQRFGRDWQISQASLLAYIRKAEKSGAKRGPKTGT
jgi:excisionase family DNA binding protein